MSEKPYAPAIVNTAAPAATSACVRMPASWLRDSRSSPITAPRPLAAPTRKKTSTVSITAPTLSVALDRRERIVGARAADLLLDFLLTQATEPRTGLPPRSSPGRGGTGYAVTGVP